MFNLYKNSTCGMGMWLGTLDIIELIKPLQLVTGQIIKVINWLKNKFNTGRKVFGIEKERISALICQLTLVQRAPSILHRQASGLSVEVFATRFQCDDNQGIL